MKLGLAAGIAVGAVVSLTLYAPPARAQSDDRFPAAPQASAPASFWSLFAPRKAAPAPPVAATLPTSAPWPRPVSRAHAEVPPMRMAATARQEELTVTAYNAPNQPTAASTEQTFTSWLPRLVSSFDPPPPATEFVPATPRPPADVVPREPALSPLVPTPRISPRRVPDDLAALIAAKAHKHGVPIDLAHAIVTVESNYNPMVTGGGATLGLMQIKHATARGMGYTGTAQELYDPATNLEWGMKYLGTARRLAKGDLCGTVLRYQAGHRAVAMNPVAREYCTKVRFLLEASAMRKRATATRSAQASVPPR
ncbi:MAG: transglycosylase SLT domain-containing protein [Variibacter sp.]|nr:transglycosylase SLT domain-containing protein [Variibacter sp.]